MSATDKVVPLHEDTPVVKVVASAVNIIIGLSDNRQMQFSTGFEGDEDDDVVNARFDRIMRFADRQKARYEIPEIEDDLHKHRDTLANFREDLERRELQHQKDQADRRVQIEALGDMRGEAREAFEAEINGTILKMQDARQDVFNAGLEAHDRSGRRGSYVPAGQTKINLKNIDLQIEKAKEHRDEAVKGFDADYDKQVAAVEAEIAKADAERDQWIGNINISIKRYEEAIQALEEKLAKRQAAATG